MKQIIITVLVVVGIVAGAMIFSGGEDIAAGQPSNNFYGQESGVITVTEYGDFECPACAGFAPIVSQVKEAFADQIRFEFRHFPLVQIHPNAQSAHRAAQAAANQGKFWEMHDILYARQQAWNTQSTSTPANIIEGYATEIGLDIEQYQTDVADSSTLATINADIDLGKNIGANATPTFVIDGTVIENTNSLSSVEGFAAAIQAAIDAKTGTSSEESVDLEAPPSPEAEPATLPEEQ